MKYLVMKKGPTIFCALIGFLLLVLTPLATHAQVTAIKAGKLVDPETGATSLNQVILIEGTKITAVGTDLQIPAEATVIDLANLTVLPGLFYCHTHMCVTVPKPRNVGLRSWLET